MFFINKNSVLFYFINYFLNNFLSMSVKYTRVSVNSTPTKKENAKNYWDYLFAEAEENFMMTNIIPLPGNPNK